MIDIPEPRLTPSEYPDLYYEDKQFVCSNCCHFIAEEQSKFNLCKPCEKSAQDKFIAFMDTFTIDERAFLNWKYDTVEF